MNLGVVVDGLTEGCRRCHQLVELTDCVVDSNIAKVMICVYFSHNLPSF